MLPTCYTDHEAKLPYLARPVHIRCAAQPNQCTFDVLCSQTSAHLVCCAARPVHIRCAVQPDQCTFGVLCSQTSAHSVCCAARPVHIWCAAQPHQCTLFFFFFLKSLLSQHMLQLLVTIIAPHNWHTTGCYRT